MAYEPVVTDSGSRSGGVKQAVWSNLPNGAAGDWLDWADFSGRTFQVYGTFGVGGSITMQGSNDLNNPTNVATLTNWQGTPLTTTSPSFMTARDMPLWVRPIVTAGDGTTSLSVALAMHRQDMSTVG